MALSSAEQVDVRRYCGYGVSPATPDALDVVLATLTTDQETVVRDTFLPRLLTLETAFIGASDNLDTKKAAVWERNANELGERSVLFLNVRFQLCRFLGIDPGPGLYDPLAVTPVPGADEATYVPAVFVV